MKDLKIGFIIAFLSFGVAAVLLSLEVMHLQGAMAAKDRVVQALIKEVGDLKGAPIKMPSLRASAKQSPFFPITKAKSKDGIFTVLIAGSHKKLTDTLMLAIVNPDAKKITLISIPRDLYIHGRRINSYYPLFGAAEMKETTEDAIGIAIDKYAVMDMKAFSQMVDYLGGIDVHVEKDLYDSLYSDSKTPYFISKGAHHLNGEEALKYVRSRKSTSDFDRAARQQQVMQAIKQKILSQNLLSRAKDAVALYDILRQNTDTDISVFEAVEYLRQYQSFAISSGNVISNANFLYSQIGEEGQYMLLPKNGDFSEIQAYVKSLL